MIHYSLANWWASESIVLMFICISHINAESFQEMHSSCSDYCYFLKCSQVVVTKMFVLSPAISCHQKWPEGFGCGSYWWSLCSLQTAGHPEGTENTDKSDFKHVEFIGCEKKKNQCFWWNPTVQVLKILVNALYIHTHQGLESGLGTDWVSQWIWGRPVFRVFPPRCRSKYEMTWKSRKPDRGRWQRQKNREVC